MAKTHYAKAEHVSEAEFLTALEQRRKVVARWGRLPPAQRLDRVGRAVLCAEEAQDEKPRRRPFIVRVFFESLGGKQLRTDSEPLTIGASEQLVAELGACGVRTSRIPLYEAGSPKHEPPVRRVVFPHLGPAPQRVEVVEAERAQPQLAIVRP